MSALVRAIAALLVALVLSAPAFAGDRRLGEAPAPSAVDVTATTWVTLPEWTMPGQATNAAFMGGGIQFWVCFAAVTVKDSASAQLKLRVLFNGAAVATPAQVTQNADGSTTRVYQINNPPGLGGSAICNTQLQVAKTSANIALRAAPAPPEEDQLALSVPTPVN